MLKPLLLSLILLAPAAFAQQAIRATTTMHGDGTRTEETINPYDKTQTAVTLNAGDKVLQRVVYQLDENNLATTAIIYDGKGIPLYKAEYKRNMQGLVSEERNFTPKDDFIRRMVYTYDVSGNMTRIDSYDVQGRLIDSRGKGIKQKPAKRR